MPDVRKEKLMADELRRQRAASEEMGDIELEMEIAPYFGYKMPPDGLKYKSHQFKGVPGDADINLGGFVVRPEDPNNPYPQEYLDGRSGVIRGVPINVPREPGTINAIHNQTTPNTWAHEKAHVMHPDLNERSLRLRDGFTAMNERDWKEAVIMWQDQHYRDTGDFLSEEKAEEELLKRMGANRHWNQKQVFEREYDRGARLPAPKEGAMAAMLRSDELEYSLEREKQTYYGKHKRPKDE